MSDHFGNRVISRGTDNPWAPHSPDLNPLDFHLWGFLKDQICGRTFQSLQELREVIIRHVREIPQDQCENVLNNFVQRIKMCLDRNGGHLEHII